MEQYLIYLRKSRKDLDAELQSGVFDTLQRHRDTLLSLAKKLNLSIANIFEEVVSGDTIAERPEMQKLLSAVESGKYAGVLVMEVPRLARGNTRDQGMVAETFQYSGTKIVTPDKTYDPNDEADQEYFEFGLFMSRREYKTINRRLQRGRIASLNEGKYIAGAAPYGYEKVKLQKQRGYSLAPIPETAEIVKHIFSLYTTGDVQKDGSALPIGSFRIANLLNSECVPSPNGGRWEACSVRAIISNPTYAGFVRWSYRPSVKKMVDGQIVHSTPVNNDAQIVQGLHQPIITLETWNAAKHILASRGHSPNPMSFETSNPLSGVLYCGVCGRSMVCLPHGSKAGPTIMCPSQGCETMSSRLDAIEASMLDGLRLWLADYEVDVCNSAPADFDAPAKDTVRNISRLEAALTTLKKQQNGLYDFLEQGVYTKDVFLERSCVLSQKISETEINIKAAQDSLAKLQAISADKINLIPKIRYILEHYNTLSSAAEKNMLLKTTLDRIVYTKTLGGRWVPSNMQLFVFPRTNLVTHHI